MAAVQLAGVRKNYGATPALDGLDLDITDGEFMVLLGPSGAGKTTTLKCIAGLEPLDAGSIHIDGRDMRTVDAQHRNVAMAFESYALYPRDTVFGNLISPLRSPKHRTAPAEAERKVREVAEILGIGALLERLPGQLSNGQRQRVALGRALIRPAAVLLLDEPLSHVDAKLRAQMRAELKSLGGMAGTTSVYVTHDYVEAVALGDRIGVLHEGRLVQVGTREELWERPANTFVARALGQPAINLLRGGIDAGGAFRTTDGAVDIRVPEAPVPPGTDVVLGVRPRDLRLGTGEAEGYHRITGTAYVTERLGRHLEVTVAVGEQHLVALGADEWSGVAPGDRLSLLVPTTRLLLFAADDRGGIL